MLEKKYFLIIIPIIFLIFILSCASDEPEGKDTIPPSKIALTPHLGDTGDPDFPNLNDKNNGIDASVSSNNLLYNWMKIQWDNTLLIQDADIDYIDVFRYPEQDTANVMFVGSMQFNPDSSRYTDTFSNVNTITEKNWNYYIVPYDESGNFTKSDTVSYMLVDKTVILNPGNNSQFNTSDTITFTWEDIPTCDYRLLFFDQTHTLIASVNGINFNTYTATPQEMGLYFAGTYTWRVDSFGAAAGGSESNERTIILTTK